MRAFEGFIAVSGRPSWDIVSCRSVGKGKRQADGVLGSADLGHLFYVGVLAFSVP